ncbi:MAG: hypothetical protein IJB74_00980 [Clostridia bacterium]|nr:hypothetical protein [Clostridia bacterium]
MNKIKPFIISEVSELKREICVYEYALWWVIRAMQIFALVRLALRDPANNNVALLSLNLLATFTVPLVRLLLLPKRIYKKLTFHCQTWLNIMIFFGSFLAQGLEWNHKITSWDKILHLIAGAIAVFIGDGIAGMFLSKKNKISPLFRTYASVGFSFIAIVIWEVFEFFADYYIVDSSNQAYSITPDRDAWFFVIFGYGVQNENQWRVFDTNVDMLCAVAGCIPAAVALWWWHKRKEKLNTHDNSLKTASSL